MGERVDSAHDALGGVEESFDGGIGKQRSVGSSDPESVLEVEACGVAVEAVQGEADGDSLKTERSDLVICLGAMALCAG